jgi:hypothetical protein
MFPESMQRKFQPLYAKRPQKLDIYFLPQKLDIYFLLAHQNHFIEEMKESQTLYKPLISNIPIHRGDSQVNQH